MYNLLKLIAF